MEEKNNEQPQTKTSASTQSNKSAISTAPHLFKPFLIVILVLLSILIVGVGAFYFGTTRNTNTINSSVKPSTAPLISLTQTAAWKTYSNTKFNYTIEYPSDLAVDEYSNSNKDGATFSDAISIAAGKMLLNYANQTLEEYAKIAGSETENRNSIASYKKVTTSHGVVGYTTTWMVQGRTIGGQPPTNGESESLPITYFAIPGNKSEIIRVELLKKEYLETYEKMVATVNIMVPLTPIPTVDESAVLKNAIKKYIALKYNSKEDLLTITVSKIEGNYAQGGVTDEGGGGMWFASKEDGAWALVWDGNGTIDCSIFSLYPNFPTTMIPECYDAAKQDIVKR